MSDRGIYRDESRIRHMCNADKWGFGYLGVVTMLVVFYSLNFLNVVTLRRSMAKR